MKDCIFFLPQTKNKHTKHINNRSFAFHYKITLAKKSDLFYNYTLPYKKKTTSTLRWQKNNNTFLSTQIELNKKRQRIGALSIISDKLCFRGRNFRYFPTSRHRTNIFSVDFFHISFWTFFFFARHFCFHTRRKLQKEKVLFGWHSSNYLSPHFVSRNRKNCKAWRIAFFEAI